MTDSSGSFWSYRILVDATTILTQGAGMKCYLCVSKHTVHKQ